MREEAAKNGQAGQMNNPANFQTMPHPPPQQQTGTMANTMGQAPQTPRHASQTMNVRIISLTLIQYSELGQLIFVYSIIKSNISAFYF